MSTKVVFVNPVKVDVDKMIQLLKIFNIDSEDIIKDFDDMAIKAVGEESSFIKLYRFLNRLHGSKNVGYAIYSYHPVLDKFRATA